MPTVKKAGKNIEKTAERFFGDCTLTGEMATKQAVKVAPQSNYFNPRLAYQDKKAESTVIDFFF
jgi:hypothetical protein